MKYIKPKFGIPFEVGKRYAGSCVFGIGRIGGEYDFLDMQIDSVEILHRDGDELTVCIHNNYHPSLGCCVCETKLVTVHVVKCGNNCECIGDGNGVFFSKYEISDRACDAYERRLQVYARRWRANKSKEAAA